MTPREMAHRASENDGRYLLPPPTRRPSHPSTNATADEREWDAAQTLVDIGLATWISAFSTMWPGIILTDKGIAQVAAESV